MRQVMPLAVAVGLVATMTAACGGGSSSSTGTSAGAGSGSAAAKNYKVTLIQGVANDPFYVSMACGAQEEATKLGVTLNVQGANAWDPNVQTPLVNSVTANKPDALLIAPNDSKAMINPLKRAGDAGIKVVTVDTSIDDDSILTSTVSSDNLEGGREAARTLAKLIGEKGSVMLVGGQPGVSTVSARQEGFETELKKYPNITYIGNVFAGTGGVARNAQLVGAQLAAHPDLAGVFALNTDTSEGAATAIRAAKAESKVKMVGFDAGPAQVEQLKKGTVQALIAQKPAEIGAQGVAQAVAALKGESVKKQVGTGAVSITADNVSDPQVAPFVYKSSC
jgi:ribose transport system substrate-binding protein